MSEYLVGSDNIDGKEQSYISTVIQKLEAKGHTCQNIGVGPNNIQSNGLSSASSGKIGVFIVGGSDIGTYVDIVTGIKNGYYHYKYLWFCFASNTATTDKWLTCNGLSNTPLVRAHDDNFSSGSSIAPYIGKPAKAYFDANKQYINYVCGKLGCSFDEIANRLANGGEDSSDDKSSTGSTIKDAIKKLLAAWDGEVECKVINEYVYINKIQDPKESYKFELKEGVNIVNDSVTITDYNPDTINFLTVHWNGGDDIVFRDEKLIARFGEKASEMDAVKKITVTKEEEVTTTDTTTATDTTTGTDTTTATDTTTGTDTSTTTTETKTVTKTEEVPVETYEEALQFANIEWAKIKRDDGHKLECKVMGSERYHVGEWCHVVIPRFDLEDYMYINKVSQSESSSGEWTANLSLSDYPPSFGVEEETEEEEEDTEDTEDTDTETTE